MLKYQRNDPLSGTLLTLNKWSNTSLSAALIILPLESVHQAVAAQEEELHQAVAVQEVEVLHLQEEAHSQIRARQLKG